MRIQASLSITDIETARRAAQCHEKGRTCYDAGLFGKTFGSVVLEQFQGIRLIGEIERREGPKTHEALKICLNDILSETPLPQLCRNASPSWRAILSLYFVWSGTLSYGEETGSELWPHIMEGLGQPYQPVVSTQCGKLFLACLKENQLEEFELIEDHQKYIARILLHGLIPRKHISRFIAELIEPELQSCYGRYVTSEHLLQKCRKISTYSYLPKPISRFVEHGRPVVDFVVKRFLEMAERWDGTQPESWQQWGLPKYMVDAFRQHVEKRGVAVVPSRSVAVQARPYLHFALDGAAMPCLHIPRQPLDSNTGLRLVWRSPVGDEQAKDISVRRTPFGGRLYSDAQEIEVAPSTQGWELVATDTLNREIFRQHVPALMLREDVPVFVFHPSTGRLLNANRAAGLPEQLLLVFPDQANLHINSGDVFNTPEHLPGAWHRWQWMICHLQADGGMQYSGPNAAFTKNLQRIPISLTRVVEQPELALRGQAPSWLRCLDGWPIFVNPSHITLVCSERGYQIWKRAFCKLSRRDKSGPAIPLKLDFSETPKGYEAVLPATIPWRPGIYDILLRGSLGIDDVELTFVVLPLTNLERHVDSETGRVACFLGHGFDAVDLSPLHRTTINRDGSRTCIKLEPDQLAPDQGEAYCGVRAFAETSAPTVLLLARSPLRWTRRAESGLYDWELWRCEPESIPLPRLNELTDARVVIQYDDPAGTARNQSAADKLSVVLKTAGSETEQALFTYSAPTFRRNMAGTWVLDLKKFADQLKSLHSVDAAAVTVRTRFNHELTLFAIQKQITLTALQVTPHLQNDGSETLHVSWHPQPNDPRSGRVVRVWPLEHPAAAQCIRIQDGMAPPVTVPLPAASQAGLWCFNLEIHWSRFGAFSTNSEKPPAFKWFRTPQHWADWLVWSEYGAEEALRETEGLQHASPSTRAQMLPWSEFLLHFHYDREGKAFQFMRKVLGSDTLLESLLPYAQNRIWDVKVGSEKRMAVKVITSSARAGRLNRLLTKQPPCLWHRLPDDIELELLLLTASEHLGNVHSVWKCTKTAEDSYACLFSEEEGHLELPIWLADALAPASNGVLMARCCLEVFWDDPPHLSAAEGAGFEDQVFALPSAPQGAAPRPSKHQTASGSKGFSLGDVISSEHLKKFNGFFKPVVPADQAEAEGYAAQWNHWLKQDCGNPFLARMLSGRLQSGPKGLSGAAALIARLRSRQQWTERLHRGELAAWDDINTLYAKTLELVCRTTPRAFLRDLILAEIILAWYWNQPLAEI